MLMIDHAAYIHAPLSQTYHQFTRYTQYPRWMQGVMLVKRPAWKHLLWKANYAGETEIWEARISCAIPNECVAWESVHHRANHMRFEFYPIAPTLTLVKLHAEYELLHVLEDTGVSLGAVSHRLFGDLKRAQHIIEGRAVVPHTIVAAFN